MEAVCAPFSFEAALGVLRCHGELIAVPHLRLHAVVAPCSCCVIAVGFAVPVGSLALRRQTGTRHDAVPRQPKRFAALAVLRALPAACVFTMLQAGLPPDSARAIELLLQCSRRILPRWFAYPLPQLCKLLPPPPPPPPPAAAVVARNTYHIARCASSPCSCCVAAACSCCG